MAQELLPGGFRIRERAVGRPGPGLKLPALEGYDEKFGCTSLLKSEVDGSGARPEE